MRGVEGGYPSPRVFPSSMGVPCRRASLATARRATRVPPQIHGETGDLDRARVPRGRPRTSRRRGRTPGPRGAAVPSPPIALTFTEHGVAQSAFSPAWSSILVRHSTDALIWLAFSRGCPSSSSAPRGAALSADTLRAPRSASRRHSSLSLTMKAFRDAVANACRLSPPYAARFREQDPSPRAELRPASGARPRGLRGRAAHGHVSLNYLPAGLKIRRDLGCSEPPDPGPYDEISRESPRPARPRTAHLHPWNGMVPAGRRGRLVAAVVTRPWRGLGGPTSMLFAPGEGA